MKVDFLVNSLVLGGAERVLVLLANYFEEQGHDVTIITFNDIEVWKPNETIKRAKLYGSRGIKNEMVRSTVVLAKHYRKKSKRPDVLISFMTRTNLIAILVARIYGIKVIASEHTNHVFDTDIIEKFTRNYVYRFADAMTCLTSYDIGYYQQRKANVHIMPNPCTYEIYKEKIREREKIILSVGALDRYQNKGFDNLIRLSAPILKKHKDWKLKFVGGGQVGMIALKELAKSLEIECQVVIEGFSDEIYKIMRNSDIYALPSLFEGLPMVLIEAMSQGMVCIAYDCVSGPSDIITHGVNGILIEDQNMEMMAKELDQLIENNEKRTELARKAVESLDNFKIETIYNKYLSIIQEKGR